MRPFPIRAATVVTLAMFALAGCSDQPTAMRATDTTSSKIKIQPCVQRCDPGDPGDPGNGGGGGTTPPPPPQFTVTSIGLNSPTLVIGGSGVGYVASISNIGATASNVALQGWMIQGSARRAANGLSVNCNVGTGVFPHGTCQVTFTVSASNTGSGVGTFTSGAATFELDLNVGGVTKATRTASMYLIPNFSVHTPSTLSLTGALNGYSIFAENRGNQVVNSLSYQSTIIQGSAQRSAGSIPLLCGLSTGQLPTFAGCPMTLQGSVTNSTSGFGTLTPGNATMRVQLLSGGTVLAAQDFPIILVNAHIVSVTPDAHPLMINGNQQLAAVTISNVGGTLSSAGVNGSIRQGSLVRTIIGAAVNCSGSNSVPSGTCVTSMPYRALNAGFTDSLRPGPATLYVALRASDIHATVYTVDTVAVPITLVGGPTLTLAAQQLSLAINGAAITLNGTIANPAAAIPGTTIAMQLLQGSTVHDAAGGATAINCNAGAGNIPSGTCTLAANFFASDTNGGVGTFVPGPATLFITIADPVYGTTISKNVTVTLRAF